MYNRVCLLPKEGLRLFFCMRTAIAFTACLILSAGANAKVLQGSVTDANVVGEDEFPPQHRLRVEEWQEKVLPRLHKGMPWSDSLLPLPATQETWVQIPSWLAGQWHTERVFSLYGNENGKNIYNSTGYFNRTDATFGMQQDSSKQYWHLVRWPYGSKVEGTSKTSYFIHYYVRCFCQNCSYDNTLLWSDFIVDFDAIEIEVSHKAPQRVVKVRKRHDTLRYEGRSRQLFDEVSVPEERFSATIESHPQQVGSYHQIDTLPDGFDVRASFKRFLTAGGMSDSVPADH